MIFKSIAYTCNSAILYFPWALIYNYVIIRERWLTSNFNLPKHSIMNLMEQFNPLDRWWCESNDLAFVNRIFHNNKKIINDSIFLMLASKVLMWKKNRRISVLFYNWLNNQKRVTFYDTVYLWSRSIHCQMIREMDVSILSFTKNTVAFQWSWPPSARGALWLSQNIKLYQQLRIFFQILSSKCTIISKRSQVPQGKCKIVCLPKSQLYLLFSQLILSLSVFF